MIRFFDILISIITLFFLLPFFLIISVIIKIDSRGPIIFKQKRVGLNKKTFYLYKLRTMNNNNTLNFEDIKISNEVTRVGFLLRKYKIDELPQFFNVLKNDMSIVGPRPEIEKYITNYSKYDAKFIFTNKPGITDFASITYFNEENIFKKNQMVQNISKHEYYIKYILPKKIKLSLIFLKNKSLKLYFKIIILTFLSIIKNKNARIIKIVNKE